MNARHLTEMTRYERRLLLAAVNSIGLDEVAGEAFHLRLFEGGRQWIVESTKGQLLVDVEDGSRTDQEQVVLPLSGRVGHFADCFHTGAVLSIADDQTIIAEAGGASAAIDLIRTQRSDPMPWKLVPSASASVPMRRFLMLLWSARCLPSGVDEGGYPTPPMWLQFDGGTLSLHVDWSDFLPNRATYRMQVTSHSGAGTVSIPHEPIAAFLQMAPWHDPDVDDEDEDEVPHLSITIGTVQHEGVDRDAIAFAADKWRLVLWLTNPMQERWAAGVNAALEAGGFEVTDSDETEWIIETAGVDVRVNLHPGHPDIARVSAVLVTSAEESFELFRELGQLNVSSNGVRYWLDDGVVRAAIDVKCTALPTLPDAISEVAKAAAAYAPMLAVLSSTA